MDHAASSHTTTSMPHVVLRTQAVRAAYNAGVNPE